MASRCPAREAVTKMQDGAQRDRYFGTRALRFEPTGFFRLEGRIGGGLSRRRATRFSPTTPITRFHECGRVGSCGTNTSHRHRDASRENTPSRIRHRTYEPDDSVYRLRRSPSGPNELAPVGGQPHSHRGEEGHRFLPGSSTVDSGGGRRGPQVRHQSPDLRQQARRQFETLTRSSTWPLGTGHELIPVLSLAGEPGRVARTVDETDPQGVLCWGLVAVGSEQAEPASRAVIPQPIRRRSASTERTPDWVGVD